MRATTQPHWRLHSMDLDGRRDRSKQTVPALWMVRGGSYTWKPVSCRLRGSQAGGQTSGARDAGLDSAPLRCSSGCSRKQGDGAGMETPRCVQDQRHRETWGRGAPFLNKSRGRGHAGPGTMPDGPATG